MKKLFLGLVLALGIMVCVPVAQADTGGVTVVLNPPTQCVGATGGPNYYAFLQYLSLSQNISGTPLSNEGGAVILHRCFDSLVKCQAAQASLSSGAWTDSQGSPTVAYAYWATRTGGCFQVNN